MPNHIHLLLSVDETHAVGRAMQMIKGGFSHAVGQAGLKLKAIWQPSYYEHRVRDEEEYERMRKLYSPESSAPGPGGKGNRIIPIPPRAHLWHLDEVPERLKPDFQGASVDAALKGRTTRSIQDLTRAE